MHREPQIWKYLKGTKEEGLIFTKNLSLKKVIINAYSDTSYGDQP